MLATIGSAIGLFAATNIDDIVVLTVLFLASDEAGFITGSTISINGGQYLT